MTYPSLEYMIAEAADMVRPPERLTVSETAARYRRLNNPGSYVGPWKNETTPYLVEPMDVTSSLNFTGMVFAGPARTGKSDMFFNKLLHTAKCDPADTMLYHITQNTARDWSQMDLGRAFRHSPELGNKLVPGRQNDNVHDKRFLSGMRLMIKWPTISEMSGKTIRNLWLMDYDRMPQDVDGEGAPFDLARKRAQTFRRFGMCVAESSPGFEITDPNWMPSTPHEAPPSPGIMALYNRGDRRRWYWRCPQCREPFEPDFSLLDYPKSADKMEAADQVTLVCPHDGFPMQPAMKHELNLGGKWIKDGTLWQPDGSVTGRPIRSDIASFWLKGPAAAFQDWSSLVLKYLQAMEEFENTGAEESLKTTVNTDQGKPYISRARTAERLPEELKRRAIDWGGDAVEPVVPAGVRFLVTTVDVQKNAFVCQTHGFGEGGDIWIVDVFKIRRSERLNALNERELLDPAGYAEDWKVLVDQVIERTYPLADGSGRRMQVKAIGCDSGGREGVTANAYNFWRYLRDDADVPRDAYVRFQLLKGEPSKSAPRVHVSYPDSQRKDRLSMARGDIPVLFLNSNLLKDQISAMLNRTDAGGAVYFASWTPDYIYSQLTNEVRSPKGWLNVSNRRNEAWDLLYYAVGIALNTRQCNPVFEKIDWEHPPGWAADWDANDLIFEQGFNKRFDIQVKGDNTLESLAADLA
jgi:phage terminase large subunit GpA-like protein